MTTDEGQPFITICMPTYNTNWCLKEVLDSIYNIDYPKKMLRLVFVDSCSTDGTWETLQQFKAKHEGEYESIILVQDPRRGVGHARNICLKYVKGWVFWADSDVTLPPEVLKHLLTHFKRDPKVGWARCAWTRESPTLYEKVAISRIPKRYRYVDETELTSSLIRPEAMEAFGQCYEDGGEPFDSWEAAEQYVKLRKAGWKIVNDGCLSSKSVHLTPPKGHWGMLKVNESGGSNVLNIVKRVAGILHYYVVKFPKRPIRAMVKAGDLKLALKLTYWAALPYAIICGLILGIPPYPFAVAVAAPLLYYAWEVRGLRMKLIAPPLLSFRWLLVSQGYIIYLIKSAVSKFLQKLGRRKGR